MSGIYPIGEQELTLNVRHGAEVRERLLAAQEVWWVVRLAPGMLTNPNLDRVVASYFRVLAPCVKMLSAAMGGRP